MKISVKPCISQSHASGQKMNRLVGSHESIIYLITTNFLTVVGGCTRLAAGDHLYLQWRGPSLGAMSRVSSPVVVVGHSPVLAGGLLSHCGHELLLSCGIGLLSSSGGYSGLFSRWRGDSSEGSMWGVCSLYMWHWGFLTCFHRVPPL